MADGQSRERRQSHSRQDGWVKEMRQDPFLEALGYLDDAPQPTTNVSSNGETYRHNKTKPAANEQGISFVAHTLEVTSGKGTEQPHLRVLIGPSDSPSRLNERIMAENLPTRQELAEDSFVQTLEGDTTKIAGQFSLDIMTVLMIGDQAYTFRRQGTGREGVTGLTDPMRQLPTDAIEALASREYFIKAKRKNGKPVIIAFGAGSDATRMARETKETMLTRLRQEQSRLLGGKVTPYAIAELNAEIRALTNLQDIVTVPAKQPEAIERSAATIDVVIEGEASQTINGFARFDAANKTLTIAQAIELDPAALEIDPSTIELLDGTGERRTLVAVNKPDQSLPPLLDKMMRLAYRPPAVQSESREVQLQKARSYWLHQQPYPTPQQWR